MRIAYIDPTNGNDATAEINDPARPFRTLKAAQQRLVVSDHEAPAQSPR